jgi:sirohydrochlorin ferrochelatase
VDLGRPVNHHDADDKDKSIMKSYSRRVLALAACVALLIADGAVVATQTAEGILLLAHGGSAAWNERVETLAGKVRESQPTEVAFGMASRGTIQSAIDRLVARGVQRIVAVPLFVSSHSSVVRSTEYLLGLRTEMPADLKIFAKMSHGPAGDHRGHDMPASAHEKNMTPVESPATIRLTAALNRHDLVGEILAERAQSISTTPARESVIIVAHGPVPDDDNTRWLEDMAVLARTVAGRAAYRSVDYLTVRDDAPAAIRDAATQELRALVSRRVAEGNRVLLVPLLMSFGGIEQGIKKRLDGLEYTMAPQGLMPDPRLEAWVKEMARPRS